MIRTRHDRAVGYTLIELLAVTVIISLLAALTLPTVKNVLTERKTSVAAIEVKAFLEAARARAIARGTPVSVIFERLGSRVSFNQETQAFEPVANPSPSSPNTNYDIYNSCIRMVMAEALRPIEIEAPVTFSLDDASGIPPACNDNDGLSEPGRLIVIPQAADARLRDFLRSGSDIDLISDNEQVYRFRITYVELRGANFFINISNEGDSAHPFGSPADVNRIAALQNTMRPFVFIRTGITRIRLHPTPRPVASSVKNLPKGTCIDLSLSGLAVNDPNVNPRSGTPTPQQLYRDTQRQFASDWILPPLPSNNPAIPLPQDLRPIYLTFHPNGSLESVRCNGLQFPSGNGTPNLARIEPHADVLLFTGRLDQVSRGIYASDYANLQDQNLKSNLTDPTGYWVRISPTSGAISVAPSQTDHILEDLAEYRSSGTDESIEHLLEDSRELVFSSEITAQ